ncbi:hypothetical protein FBU30_008052 [Linnemannia zychae]|nr:hypothetical protein FBU30_008052 [Linnemannia zychae]
MRLSFPYRRADISASTTTPARSTLPFSLKAAFFLSVALCSFAPTVAAQATRPANITLSFYDEAGGAIGQPISVSYSECAPLDISSLAGQNYTTVKASDPRAGLNVFSDPYCQVPEGSVVGEWKNASPISDMLTVIWEGTAPAERATGSYDPNAFPENMTPQVYNPVEDDGTKKGDPVWTMDPSKGRVVVGIVAGVMIIGVAIGVYQVYVAAQYKPPPKKPKKPKTGLNVKKIKKKDAYYRKPVRTEDNGPGFQRLQSNNSEPYSTGTVGSRPPAMTERSRDSQYSEAATFVDWNNQNQQRSSPLSSSRSGIKGYQDGSDSVSIDMPALNSNNNNNNNNHSTNNRSAFPSPYAADLINFDNGPPAGRGYGQQNNQPYRGRGGEVLVPMDTLDSHQYNQYNNNNGRSAVRRTSSSRSR